MTLVLSNTNHYIFSIFQILFREGSKQSIQFKKTNEFNENIKKIVEVIIIIFLNFVFKEVKHFNNWNYKTQPIQL